MSETSSSVHFYQRTADEIITALKQARLRGAVFPATGRFTTCVVAESDVDALVEAAGGTAIHYWFYADVGFVLQLYRDGTYRGRLTQLFEEFDEVPAEYLDETDITGFSAEAFIEAGIVDRDTAARIEARLEGERDDEPDFYWIAKTFGFTHFEWLGSEDLDHDNYGLAKHGAQRVERPDS